ncbi:hypothetical protein [Clostridium estertheticum]|uniref:hypothetical protein n=1 Tax=Clostridium estertheticum TaxID=238834 RepID=UPI000AC3D184|nr:hypothetical protein [Clostridium estertheticum]
MKIKIKCKECGTKTIKKRNTLKAAKKVKKLLNMKYICPVCEFRKLVNVQLSKGY